MYTYSCVSAVVLICALIFSVETSYAAVEVCNAAQLEDAVSGCHTDDPNCIIVEEILCSTENQTPCTSCYFDLTEHDYVKLASPSGAFRSGGLELTVKAKRIVDERGSASAVLFRTEYAGGGGTSADTVLISTDEPSDCGEELDISITGRIENPVSGGDVDITGHCIEVGSIANGHDKIMIDAGEDITVKGTLDTDSGSGGGVISLTAGHDIEIKTGNGLEARCTAICNVHDPMGSITLRSKSEGDDPQITVRRKLVTGTSVTGGSIKIDMTPEDPNDPMGVVEIHANVQANGCTSGLCNGGTVEITGRRVLVKSGTLAANGSTKSGYAGGAITIEASETAAETVAVELGPVNSRGHTGGDVTVLSDADMLFRKAINVSSNKGPDGEGGRILVDTWSEEPSCADANCSYPRCDQHLQVDGDIRAKGYGTSGVGGGVTIHASEVQMHESQLREINANAKQTGFGGSAAGAIDVRTKDVAGTIIARTTELNPNKDHKITAQSDGSDTGTIHITDVTTGSAKLGGSWDPDEVEDLEPLDCWSP